jgi:hypothetical protein
MQIKDMRCHTSPKHAAAAQELATVALSFACEPPPPQSPPPWRLLSQIRAARRRKPRRWYPPAPATSHAVGLPVPLPLHHLPTPWAHPLPCAAGRPHPSTKKRHRASQCVTCVEASRHGSSTASDGHASDGVGCMRIGGGERNHRGGGAQVLVAYFTGGIVRAVRRKTVLTTLV